MTCCCPIIRPECESSAAQFYVMSSPASKDRIPMKETWNYGTGISLSNDTTILLKPCWLYEISYVFLATTEAGNFFEIVPCINGTLRILYASMGTAGNNRNASTSASFLINDAANAQASLAFSLTYPEGVRNIDLSGIITVQSHKIPPEIV